MNIRDYLTKRNIIGFLIIAILLFAILISVKLVQQRQNLKSKAANLPQIVFSGSGVTHDDNFNYSSTQTTVTVELRAPDPASVRNW